MTRLGDILDRNRTPVAIRDDETYAQVTVRTNHNGVVPRGEKHGSEIGTKNQCRVSPGQFLLSRIDARHAAFGMIPEELAGAVVTNDFLAFDIREDRVERGFFDALLKSPVFLEACVKASRGNTNRKRVNEAFFLDYEVSLPSLKEQRRLLKRIERGQAVVASVEAEIARQRDLLALLRQSILDEAVRGRLTAAWRAGHPVDEPAPALLARIATERAQLVKGKKLRKAKPLPPLTSDEQPFDLPAGWAWCRLGDVVNLLDADRVPISKADRKTRKKVHPYYGASGVIDKIDGYTHDGRFLLVGEDGSNLRRRSTPVAFEAEGKIWVNNHAHVLAFDHVALQRLIEIRINGMDLDPYVSGGFQPKLSQGNLLLIPVPLPPLAEQTAIATRVASLLSTCDTLDREITRSATHATALLRAVLREAFAPTDDVH